MINDNDIQLSKMSFTDKDFASLYPDLLDLARQLTNEWDPSQSTNESDPGVVLLKEGAFIADHNNYNIDKNILEAFLPSATQDRSVRNITEMNGYTPRYYVSAVGDVTITYKPEDETNVNGFIIPAFTLVATNKNEDIAYTQVSNLTINRPGIPSSCRFMEGTLNTLKINGTDQILLENIDENNRLYLPNIYIPQNGIFVKNYGSNDSDLWVRNNYLLTQPLGSKIYKFDFDSSVNLPYIEFPTDIVNIIENGLSIRYISTTGVNGNIKSNELIKIQTPKEYVTTEGYSIKVSEDFEISNQSSIFNGKNPETINEMYRSFKKVVGTFDTLVTTKDYTNAIFNFEDEYNNPIISNDVVTDIRNDYNYSANVITFDQYGEYFENVSLNSLTYHFVLSESEASNEGDIWFNGTGYSVIKNGVETPLTSLSYKDFSTASEAMTPYDLCIHALKAFSMSDYLASDPSYAIKKSFEPADIPTMKEIKTSLGELKCINHTFKDIEPNDVYYFKNYVPLYVTVTPYSKVTEKEKNEIFQNLYKAISSNFNARMVEFGEELNYDEVLDVLNNADDRIKSIRLEDFEYRPVAVKYNPNVITGDEITEYDVYSTTNSEILVDLVAKNVLAGRLCLFNIDENYDYKYGQQDLQTFPDIINIETQSVIPSNSGSGGATTETKTTNVEFSGEETSEGKWGVELRIPEATSSNTFTVANGSSKKLPVGMTLQVTPVRYFNNDLTNYTPIDSEQLYFSNNINNDYVRIYNNNVSGNTSNWTFSTSNPRVVPSGALSIDVSEVVNQIDGGSINHVVQQNEYVQIAYPNYYSTKIYPVYCYYRYYLGGAQSDTDLNNHVVKANTDYRLKSGEYLIMLYTKDDQVQVDKYGPGDTIRTSFDMKYTDSSTGTKVEKTYTNEVGAQISGQFMALSASQQIEIRELLETTLNNISTPCFWITNNPGNILFEENQRSVILNSGEYFIYSNLSYDSMVILGAGTKLTRSSNDNTQWALGNTNVTITSINEEGYSAGITWVNKDFSGEGNAFKIQEMNIVTLGPDDKLIISGDVDDISNEWQTLPKTPAGGDDLVITYIIGDSSTTLKYNGTFNYEIRSRLDISLNDLQAQTLGNNQSVTIEYLNASGEKQTTTIQNSSGNNVTIQSSTNLELIGDNSIDLSLYSNNNIPVGLMSYTETSPTITIGSETQELEDVNGSYSVNISGDDGELDFPFGYNVTFNDLSETYKQYILPIFLLRDKDPEDPQSTAGQITVQIYNGDTPINFIDYNSTSPATSMALTDTNMYLLSPVLVPNSNPGNVEQTSGSQTINTNLTLKITWSSRPVNTEAVVIYNPMVIDGINSNLSFVTLNSVLNRINEIVSNSNKPDIKPYYIHKPDSDMAIQDEDITNPNIFWDKNNVANIITIPQIDLENSNFEILKSMDLTLRRNSREA